MVWKTKKKLKGELKKLAEEIKELDRLRKNTKHILLGFEKECHRKMVVFDSELALTNNDFNLQFEKVVNKFRKEKGGVK